MAGVAFLNFKGGCGKSTLSINIAAAFALRGRKVLLIDADLQHSALDWQASRQADPLFSVVGIPTKTLHKEAQLHAKTHDFIIVDGPPRIDEIARSAIMAADLVLIPVNPSPYDVWSASEIVQLLSEAAVFKDNLKSAFVINRRIVGSAIGRDVAQALAEYNLPVLTSTVAQRVIFAESAAGGMSVIEQDPKSHAAEEINALADEIERLVA